jgi:hypothetical protein
MCPQFLYIILAVLTLLALLVLYLAISPLMERPAIVAAAEISGKAQNLQQWLDAVSKDYTSFDRRSMTMEEYEQSLQSTLKEKVDAAQYGQWISGRQRELEECLGDDGLRTKVAALFSNGQLNEYAFVDRKDEKTPWFAPHANPNAPFPPEEPTMEKTRKTLHAAVDVYKTMQEKFFQDNERGKNDKWIRFAANLDFAHEGQNLAEMFTCVQDAPFVTPTEIEMTHCIFKWLTGDDAWAVGIRDVDNYNDAMQKFAKISIEWEKYTLYGEPTGGSIPDNELAPEDRKLKKALEALQQSVLSRTEYDTDRK